jgi:hypothetical protein
MTNFENELTTSSGVPLAELHRQAELFLTSTVQLGVAMDAKAAAVAAGLGAVSAGLMAALVAIASDAHVSTCAILAAAISAICLFAGACCATYAASAVDYYVPGYEPRKLAKAAIDEDQLLRDSLEDIQMRIDSNKAVIEKVARWFNRGILLGLMALPAGIAAAGIWAIGH